MKNHSDITVLYHRDADGFGSAYALWRKWGGTANYISVQYGEPVPEIPEDTATLYIVDFSYDRATCDRLAKDYDLQVIDHHKTAEKELEGAEYAIFDMNHSGCVLTWKHLFPEEPVPDILQYVEDRDLWKWEMLNSDDVNLYISSIAEDFFAWDAFDYINALSRGASIKAFRDKQIKSVINSARYSTFEALKVVVVNCSANISETGHRLLEEFPKAKFAILYCDRRDGKRSYSLRSRGDWDVASVARMYGGGGHTAAAGFTLNAPAWIGLDAIGELKYDHADL